LQITNANANTSKSYGFVFVPTPISFLLNYNRDSIETCTEQETITSRDALNQSRHAKSHHVHGS
jgi:hypothetical protein